MKTRQIIIALFLLFALVANGQQVRNELGKAITLNENSVDFVPGEVIIKFKDGLIDRNFSFAAESPGARDERGRDSAYYETET